MKVRLLHYCNLEGCSGVPGDVVDVSEEQAAAWCASGGACSIEPRKQEPGLTRDDIKKPDVRTAAADKPKVKRAEK